MSDSTRSQTLIGVVMYLVAAFLFAFNGSTAKLIMAAGLPPERLTELRNAGALVVLVIVVAIIRPQGFRVARSEWRFLVAYGVIAFTVVQFLYFLTISRLPLGVGTLLAFLAPVIVALWNRWVRKVVVSSTIWLALALTLIGLALVTQIWQGLSLDLVGFLAGLGTACGLALYWMLGEAGQRQRDALSLTMWGFVFSSLAWSILQPWWGYPWSVLTQPADPLLPGTPSLPVWVLMTWGIVMGTVVPFLLVLGALRRLGAQRAGIVGTSEPIWAAVIAVFTLGEAISPIQAVGGLVVIAGIVLAETARGVNGSQNEPESPRTHVGPAVSSRN
ncbi:MAG: EamA family transporter [Actinomycetales bacterium]|nr:EamA family transporter [Actinomycetales bacterium]